MSISALKADVKKVPEQSGGDMSANIYLMIILLQIMQADHQMKNVNGLYREGSGIYDQFMEEQDNIKAISSQLQTLRDELSSLQTRYANTSDKNAKDGIADEIDLRKQQLQARQNELNIARSRSSSLQEQMQRISQMVALKVNNSTEDLQMATATLQNNKTAGNSVKRKG